MIWSDTPCWETCLERRQRDAGGAAARLHRVHRRAAPVDGRTTACFADIILPIEHEVRRRSDIGTDSDNGQWNGSCTTSARPSSLCGWSRSPTMEAAGRGREGSGEVRRHLREPLRTLHGRQDHARTTSRRGFEKHGSIRETDLRGVQGKAVLHRSPRAKGGRTMPAGFSAVLRGPGGTSRFQTPSGKLEYYSHDVWPSHVPRRQGARAHTRTGSTKGDGHRGAPVPATARAEVPVPARVEPSALARARADLDDCHLVARDGGDVQGDRARTATATSRCG